MLSCYFFYPLHLYVFVLICQYYVVLLERTNKDIIYILFMHLLVVDYIIVILFCTMFQKVKLIDYKDFRINVRVC